MRDIKSYVWYEAELLLNGDEKKLYFATPGMIVPDMSNIPITIDVRITGIDNWLCRVDIDRGVTGLYWYDRYITLRVPFDRLKPFTRKEAKEFIDL